MYGIPYLSLAAFPMQLIKCSAELLMGADDEGANANDDLNLPTAIRNHIDFTCWKINPSDPVEDGASSSTPTLTADDAVPSMKRLSRHPTVCTPSKPNEEKKKGPKLEDSDVDEVCGPAYKKEKRQRYIEDDSKSA
ncbi:hypothetical protein Tco_1024926 [Tanacetum coccineum]